MQLSQKLVWRKLSLQISCRPYHTMGPSIQLLHSSSYYTINLIQVESEKKNDAKFVGADLTFVS
jgi:hypothetical protein